MNILFLDIDGVLAPWDADGLDPACVARLDELLSRTGARLVLTSSWREHTPLEQIERELHRAGLRHPLRHATPILPSAHRVDEIHAWLDAHPDVERFVALDDEPLPGLEASHIRVDDAVGLTDDDVVCALTNLNASIPR